MSIPKEIAKKVKLLEIKTRRLVNSTFAGQYHSAFKGQGMTFADFREYVPGDEVRSISWPLSARTGKVYIKKYEEERELTLMLAVDISASLEFGSRSQFKGEVINHLSALLGFAAQKNNDNVGLLLFSDQVELYVPPKKGRSHVQRILTDLYNFKPKSSGTNINTAVDYLKGVLRKKANIFLFSDFIGDQNFGTGLRVLSKKHETVAVMVQDPLELQLPEVGLVDFYDAETDEIVTVDTSSKAVREQFVRIKKEQLFARDRELKRSQIAKIEINNGEEFIDPLIDYFRRRGRR